MNLRPLPVALGALAGGILVAPALPLPPLVFPIVTILCVAAGLLFARRPPLMAGCLLLALALFGAERARLAAAPAPDDVSRWIGGPSVWTLGTVASDLEERPERRTFLLAVRAVHDYTAAHPASGLVRVTLRSGPALIVGDEVWMRGRIAAPAEATNPGGFDYAAYLRRNGVRATLAARRAVDVRPTGRALGFPAARLAARLREAMRNVSARHLAREDAALLDALLLSVRSGIPPELDDAFARTGTVHVLSVSGLHVAALAWFLGWLAGAFSAPRFWANGGITALIWLYALAAGAGPAAVRSALMISVLLVAPLVRRSADPFHSLLLAAFLILCLSPPAIYDVGTQLSFATVGTLLLWMPPLERLVFPWEPGMRIRAKAARWTLLAFVVGGAAQAGAWPLVAFHFNLFSVVAPLANVFIAPLTEGLILVGLAAAALGPIPVLGAAPFVFLLAPGLKLLRVLVFAFAALPWAAVSVASPPVWFLVVYYALLWGLAPVVRDRVLRKTLFAPGPPAAVAAADGAGMVGGVAASSRP